MNIFIVEMVCFMVFNLRNDSEPAFDLDEFERKKRNIHPDGNGGDVEGFGNEKGVYPLFTEQVREDLLQGVRDGLGESTNIRNAGILPSTFYKWRRDARENWEDNPDHVMVKFFKEFDAEKAKHQKKLLRYVDPMSNPKYAMQLLEKLYDEDFGKKETVEHTGEVKAEVSMQEKKDRLMRIMKQESSDDD